MTPEQFCYWLQGKLEIDDPKELNEKQLQVIKDHLNLVFKKETPNRNLPIDIIADPTLKLDETKLVQQRTLCAKCGAFSCLCHLFDPNKKSIIVC